MNLISPTLPATRTRAPTVRAVVVAADVALARERVVLASAIAEHERAAVVYTKLRMFIGIVETMLPLWLLVAHFSSAVNARCACSPLQKDLFGFQSRWYTVRAAPGSCLLAMANYHDVMLYTEDVALLSSHDWLNDSCISFILR
jgi:hypothetical protein